MVKVIFASLAIILNVLPSCGQTLLAELTTNKQHLTLMPLTYNDSIFYSFSEHGQYKDFWIRKDGTVNDAGINRPVFAIIGSGNSTHYYSLNKVNTSFLLHVLTKGINGVTEIDSSFLDISNDMWVSSYVDKNLFVVLFNKEANEIIWHEIDGVRLLSSKKFKMPFNLAFHLKKSSQLEFINEAGLINTFSGSSKIKFFRYGKELYLVLDRPYKSINEKGITHVVKFSYSAQQVTHHEFPTNATVDFSSFFIDEKLFRSFVTSKKFIMRIYDLTTKEVLSEKEIVRSEDNTTVFTRHSRKNSIQDNETLAMVMKLATISEPSLAMVKDGEKYQMLWGTFYNENHVTAPGMLNPFGVISWVAFNAVVQSMEKPGISRYIYFACDSTNLTFEPSQAVSPTIAVRKLIDTYEVDLEKKNTKIDFKVYLPFEGGLVGVYYLPKEDLVKLVRFEAKNR